MPKNNQKKSGATWTDIFRPTKTDLNWLKKNFRIHPVILEELKGPSARARVEDYGHYLYLIYYFPIYDKEEQTSHRTEIDFIITKNAIITVHYEKLEALSDLKTKSEANSYKLIYKIISALMDFEERQLRHVGEKVEIVSKELFKDKEKEVLKMVSRLKRDISEYRIIVRHQGSLLRSFAQRGKYFWGADSEVYLNDLVGDHLKIIGHTDDYRETISDFEDTNNQLMDLKINAVMQTFTTLSFLTFPFMLIAAIFSMNTKDTPLINTPNAFWIVFGFMAAAMISLVIYFKKRGWL
ncbi:MAG: magnesium transporter CorA family protein [Patescibacteria group bacterium]|nr:magnesium transporter CorA family protein [Patescibacteria group bacterium]MDE2015628.1 magnesium transporter CorA family protein [Patescibacteria group bacterium]MDE2226685.1 magnesium transporter CorA family protein [Patescibacteria group bacterium]